MPFTNIAVPLDAPGRVTLAENSQRVNGISVTKLSAGAEFRLDFGNSQQTSPITSRCHVRVSRGVTVTDKQEGVYLVNDSAQVGSVAYLTISYQRRGDPPNEGIEIVQAS